MEELAGYVFNALPYVFRCIIRKDYVIIEVEKKNLLFLLRFLRDDPKMSYQVLLDIWSTDSMKLNTARFSVCYLLLNVSNGTRVVVRIVTDANIESVSSLYSSGTWLEREVWDLYGIIFFGNVDLRRILTDYGFDGFPLRKDFPLSGFTEVRYDDAEKRIVYEPLEMAQEYRLFEFRNPWTYA